MRSATSRCVLLTAVLMSMRLSAPQSTASKQPQPALPQKSAQADGFSFADQPNFVVSGVTDWTAAGGHGSDVTLRTSEELARATTTLKASDSRPTTSSALFNAADEAKLLANVASAPGSFAPNLALGEFYLRSGHHQQALAPLQAASTASHGSPEAEYDLAQACRGLHDAKQAKLHVDRALVQKDVASYHLLAGELYEDLGDPYSAVQQMKRATELDAAEPNYFAWASELLLHRAIAQAAEVFEHGAAAYPSSVRMRTGWGSALFAAAQYDQAAQQLCAASDLQPDDTAPYLFLGKIDEASPAPLPCVQQRIARFVQLQPGNAAAHYLFATALYRRERESGREASVMHLKEAIRLNPAYAEAYLQLGIVFASTRDFTQAAEFYKQAVVANPTLADAHFRLAVAYDRIGQPELAKQERALYQTIKQRQAEATEQDRRSLKQFVVQDVPAVAPRN
ncbi:MAG: tetratricopeptide repeat protein [Janthinobacterium lividum]